MRDRIPEAIAPYVLLQIDGADLPQLGDGQHVRDRVVGGHQGDQVGRVGHAVQVGQAAAAEGEGAQVGQLAAEDPAIGPLMQI